MTDDQWAGLSLAELLAAREALDAKIQAVRSEARDAAIAQIRELMATYHLSQADVMPGAAAAARTALEGIFPDWQQLEIHGNQGERP